jgi:urease accessory protein
VRNILQTRPFPSRSDTGTPARGMALLALTACVLAASPALAHTGEGMTGGFVSGLLHPIFGWDHVVAMVAVGLWGAVLGSPAIWILPITFPLVMALGAALGIAGIPVPFIEAGIALSGIVLGLLVLFLVRAPVVVAGVLVAFFAVFHGYAHGTELPDRRESLRLCHRLRDRNRPVAWRRHRSRRFERAGMGQDGDPCRRCNYCAGRNRLPDRHCLTAGIHAASKHPV